ncbi:MULTISPECIES: hypothetical protein [unclassified Azospirillum]|uniref:hypothetical protein n=1 Tax=unclassified Azospirillum TaxID=2630922 RepID=UPI0011B259E7|nr:MULTISPECIES: hypothetical protein [unclassified Azospirillum]
MKQSVFLWLLLQNAHVKRISGRAIEMKPILAIDPSVCAIPAIAQTRDDVEGAIKQIGKLSKDIRECGWCTIGTLSDAATILASAGYFPISTGIRKMLEDYNLSSVYSAEEIRKSVNSILERAAHLEEISGVDFFIPTEVDIHPSADDVTFPPELREALSLLLGHLGVAHSVGGVPRSMLGVSTISSRWNKSKIEFKGKLEDISPWHHDNYEGKAHIDLEVSVCQSADELRCQLDADDIWRSAQNENAIKLAIELAAQNMARTCGLKSSFLTPTSFSIGPHFITSLNNWEASGDGRYSSCVFETCVRIAIGQPKYVVNEMLAKTGSKGKAEVHKCRKADGAGAYRTHVSKDHEAVRLMYWKRNDGHIEFANVGAKHDLEIF